MNLSEAKAIAKAHYDDFVYVAQVGDDWTDKDNRGDCNVYCKGLNEKYHAAGIPTNQLARLLLDVNPNDQHKFDHYAGAVKIGGKWYAHHCWTPELIHIRELQHGGYDVWDNAIVPPVYTGKALKTRIVQHRVLSSTVWMTGRL